TGCAVVIGGLFVIHYFQAKRIAQALLWQANRAEEKGENEKLVSYLRRYLEFMPQDIEARARLGQVWGSDAYANNVRARLGAVRALDTVLTSDPTRHDLRRKLIRLALETGQYKLAGDHLKELVSENGTPRPALTDAELGEVEGYWGRLCEAERE